MTSLNRHNSVKTAKQQNSFVRYFLMDKTRLRFPKWVISLMTYLALFLTIALSLSLSQTVFARDLDIPINPTDNINQIIKTLKQQHTTHPQDIKISVKLAASYYRASNFSRGNTIFKKLLNSEQTPSNVKANIITFIKKHQKHIKTYTEANQSLTKIKQAKLSIDNKYKQIQAILSDHSQHLPTKFYLISLLIVNNEKERAWRTIKAIPINSISPEDEEVLKTIKEKHNQRFNSKQKTHGAITLLVGYDSLVNNATTNDSDIFESSALEQTLNEYYDDDIFFDEDDFQEEFIDEDDFFDEDIDEEQLIEDFIERELIERESVQRFSNSTDSLFNAISGNIQHKLVIPHIKQGVMVNTYDIGFRARYTERTYREPELDNHNYQILELGTWAGINPNNQTRLSFPVAARMISLNQRDYARYYEFKPSLHYRYRLDTQFSITSTVSHRDYTSFNANRNNGLFTEGKLSLRHRLTPSLRINGYTQYSNLDIPDEAFRSYDRVAFGLTLNSKQFNVFQFGIGTDYQIIHYHGENPLLLDIFGDPLYDFSREDETLNIFITGKILLNKRWEIPIKWTYQDRQSNQSRYDYDHSILTMGLTIKFD